MMGRLGIAFPYLLFGGIVAVVAVSNIPNGDSDRGPVAMRITMCAPCGMEVDPATALSADLAGRTQFFCGEECRQEALAAAETSRPATPDRLVDVVCNMEVNAAWNIRAEHDGEIYFFCLDKCRALFESDPEGYLAARCMVCQTPLADRATYTATYLGNPYELCSPEHRAEFKQDPAAHFMHSMWGIPSWLYYASIALVLVVSFGVFDWLSRRMTRAQSGRMQAGEKRPRIGREQIRGDGERLAERLGLGRVTGWGSATSIALPIAGAPEFRLRSPVASPLVGDVSAPRCAPRHPQEVTLQEPPDPGVREGILAPAVNLAPAGHGNLAPTVNLAPAQSSDRFDLLSIGVIRAALRSRIFRFVVQAGFVAAFLGVIAAGLFGNQNPALNIAPILTWTIWWALLIVLIMFAGKAWCYVCPWDAIAGWAEKLSFWKKTDDGLSLGLKWPRVVRNISIATILFIGLTWVELGFGVTMKPRITAYLAIAMLLMAVGSALIFDRKSFCRYGCLVGRVSGLYALFAGTEVRVRDRGVCAKCRTKECVKGSETAYGCPTFLYPGKLETNTYCIQCMECVQACPVDNLAVNLRPWGADLAVEGKPRADEAYLALLMLSITGFHGLTMTPVWQQIVDAFRDWADVGRIVSFSLGMVGLLLAPIAVYAALVWASKWLADTDGSNGSVGAAGGSGALTYRDYFIRYAYALLPIALFYHVAHNLEHLLMEGPKVLAMVSDPFGWNWNLLGTANWSLPPLISLDRLWLVQVFLVLVGHVYSLWVAQQTSLRLFGSAKAAFRSQLPMLFGMICFSVFSLWLLKQPMEMRTSAM